MTQIRLFTPNDPAGFVPQSLHGDSIEVQSGRIVPGDLYLIYFSARMTGTNLTWVVKHVSGPLAGSIEDTELAFFTRAKNGPAYDPTLSANGFDRTIVWKKATYLTLVVDLDGYDFHWDRVRGIEPVTFLKYKGTDPARFDPNYAFYDARSVVIAGCKGVRMINHFTKKGGTPIGEDDTQRYCMVFNMSVLMAPPSIPQPLGWDPDSENQGPDGDGDSLLLSA
ncbi:hypothetical protein ACFQ1E_08890 [Sphingomonas canadensis]|uniref:Nucleotide modification associated domain-containing protein n=1 Tax=Sphingomonas canadensis TaxID=1219257 RepID=A0ABW3H6Z9_9SPHN|nr:hypothetical protein [Sphingomonas canadensis]MCW3836155.1 hypothetical protein [Sphingomonas canadensis]